VHKSVTTEMLVVGGDGIIGSSLVAQFRGAGNRIMYTSRRKHKIPSDCLQLDLESVDDLSCTAEVVIICAAIHDYETCERYPNQSRRVNVENTVKLATNLYSRGAHIIFLSTSGVFNGTEPEFRAETLPAATTEMGRQKMDGEKGILALGNRTTIVRSTKLISTKTPRIAEWLAALNAQQIIRPLSNFYLSPISLKFMLNAILTVALQRCSGILHLSGKSALTYSDLMYQICAAMRLDTELVVPMDASSTNIPRILTRNKFSLGMATTTASIDIRPQSITSVVTDLMEEYANPLVFHRPSISPPAPAY